MFKRQLQLPRDKSFFLFGPRQTGKSTLLKKTFSDKESLYYDLLRTDEYTRLAANPSLFREEVLARDENKTHVIVDEVQRVPALLNEVQSIMTSPGKPPVFCLSGSSARKLKRAQANLLAGRAWTCRLHPLTHLECGAGFSLDKALRTGTLPSIYSEKDEESAHRSLKAYVNTYLQEEIAAEAITRNIGAFLRFLPLAAFENGRLLNYSSIAKETGISYKTVQEYFQVLQDTLVGFLLPAFSRSARKQLARHPKFYFFDTGVHRAICGKLSVPLQPGTSEYGDAFEHFVICETARLIDYAGKDHSLSFYRTKDGAEVDLVVETPAGKIFAIEIKSSRAPSSAHLRGLKSFGRDFPDASLFCVAPVPRARLLDGIKIVPWQELFGLIGL
ncbi:MAG TPA: ATP-binding protein [Elusimicrobiales bacterium]|nr:ATP-binding protein [Elusimicrobiales bacterium]